MTKINLRSNDTSTIFRICKVIVLGPPTPNCQTASILPQAIELPTVLYNKASDNYPFSTSGFLDTLENTHPGICGTKKVTLDLANTSAGFLTLTEDTDIITFAYDKTKTTESDIGIHTVNYTVEITDYKDFTTSLIGSCTFEI